MVGFVPKALATTLLLFAASCTGGDSALFTHLKGLADVGGRGHYDVTDFVHDKGMDIASLIRGLEADGFVLDATILDEDEVICGAYSLPVAGEFALRRVVSVTSPDEHSFTVLVVVDAECFIQAVNGWVSPRSAP